MSCLGTIFFQAVILVSIEVKLACPTAINEIALEGNMHYFLTDKISYFANFSNNRAPYIYNVKLKLMDYINV